MFVDNHLSKYRVFKSFLHKLTVLVCLPKLEKDLGLAFGAYFLHTISIKIFLIWYSINWHSCQTYFLLKISNNLLLNSYLGNCWCHKIYPSSSWTMTGRKKERKREIQIFEHLEKEKRFLDEVKNIFHNF